MELTKMFLICLIITPWLTPFRKSKNSTFHQMLLCLALEWCDFRNIYFAWFKKSLVSRLYLKIQNSLKMNTKSQISIAKMTSVKPMKVKDYKKLLIWTESTACGITEPVASSDQGIQCTLWPGLGPQTRSYIDSGSHPAVLPGQGS